MLEMNSPCTVDMPVPSVLQSVLHSRDDFLRLRLPGTCTSITPNGQSACAPSARTEWEGSGGINRLHTKTNGGDLQTVVELDSGGRHGDERARRVGRRDWGSRVALAFIPFQRLLQMWAGPPGLRGKSRPHERNLWVFCRNMSNFIGRKGTKRGSRQRLTRYKYNRR